MDDEVEDIILITLDAFARTEALESPVITACTSSNPPCVLHHCKWCSHPFAVHTDSITTNAFTLDDHSSLFNCSNNTAPIISGDNVMANCRKEFNLSSGGCGLKPPGMHNASINDLS